MIRGWVFDYIQRVDVASTGTGIDKSKVNVARVQLGLRFKIVIEILMG